MFFASDNSGPAHPQILESLARANDGYALAYGGDPLTGAVCDRLRALFDAPEAAVHLVATGTAANSLALATLAQPWQTVFCSPVAHIHQDECNAPEFFSGGAKLTLVGDADRMTSDALRAAIEAEETRGVHGPQRGPVSITQITECGTVHTLDDLRGLTEVARSYGLAVHMDGARFANALAALGCSPADMTWKAGIDAVSFGGTKNGCMGVEAVIFFDPGKAREFELRRKRGAHLVSKHRYLAAQMQGYLQDDLWLDLAGRANAACARLATGLRAAGATFLHRPDANMVFAALPRRVHRILQAEGAVYHLWGGRMEGADEDELIPARLVCDWSISDEMIDRFLGLVRG